MLHSVVDLDEPKSWPNEIREELGKNLDYLIEERAAEREYDLSSDRWLQPAPPSPFTKRAHRLILDRMQAEELRVFHATRLLDFDEVRTKGLLPLVFDERINRLRELAAQRRLAGFAEDIDAATGRVDANDPYLSTREGQVWATPMRRYLHDGRCDVFFEHWGGEAVQRFTMMASPQLEAAIKQIGEPAVVIAKIPAIGVCERAISQLPQTMVELALASSGRIEVPVGAWDVRAKVPFLPEWIEDIVPPDDPTVATR